MIQRLQTIWLLLAATAAFLTFRFSFYSGNVVTENDIRIFEPLNATSNLVVMILTAILGGTSLIAVFLFKHRKLQMRLCIVNLLISLFNFFLYFRDIKKYAEGNFDLTSLFVFIIPLFLILAFRGIYKDEKLLKSLDRLR
jgi:hypothetical protein